MLDDLSARTSHLAPLSDVVVRHIADLSREIHGPEHPGTKVLVTVSSSSQVFKPSEYIEPLVRMTDQLFKARANRARVDKELVTVMVPNNALLVKVACAKEADHDSQARWKTMIDSLPEPQGVRDKLWSRLVLETALWYGATGEYALADKVVQDALLRESLQLGEKERCTMEALSSYCTGMVEWESGALVDAACSLRKAADVSGRVLETEDAYYMLALDNLEKVLREIGGRETELALAAAERSQYIHRKVVECEALDG